MSVAISSKITADGSPTLYRVDLDEPYHSIHGARQESMHVFIEMGLKPTLSRLNTIRILEMGFGTGLNALLTEEHAPSGTHSIEYCGLETVPLKEEVWQSLDYGRPTVFNQLHSAPWGEMTTIREGFRLQKQEVSFQEFKSVDEFDLIYWDAFGPNTQAELWTLDIFEKCFSLMNEGGMLVTYCAKGAVRRAMQAAGFEVERLPGPPGKREMLRATKRKL